MRNQKSIGKRVAVLLIMIICVVILTGCMPPKYTNAHKKELTKEHYPDVLSWFSENIPEARVKSGSAYTNGIDLCMAMEGDYTVDGETFEYVYDYYNDKMYVEDGYAEVCEMIKNEIAGMLGIAEDIIDISYESDNINTKTDNDNGDNSDLGYVQVDGLIPYGEKPGDYAYRSVHEGTLLSYFVYVYGDKIPVYDQALYASMSNLGFVKYYVPAELESEMICSAIFDENDAEYTFINTVKTDNKKLYAGYTYTLSVAGEPVFDNDSAAALYRESIKDISISCEIKDKKSLSLQVPPEANPMLLYSKKYDIAVDRIRYDGEIQSEEMNRSEGTKIMNGSGNLTGYYDMVFSDDGYYCYKLPYAMSPAEDGVYNFSIKK